MSEILEGTAMELMVFDSGSDEQCNNEGLIQDQEEVGRTEGERVVTSDSVVQEEDGQDKVVMVDSGELGDGVRPEVDTFEGSSASSSPTITKQSNENSTTAIGISVHPIPLCN